MHAQAAQLLEGVAQQQVFAFCIDGRALEGQRVPGAADLQRTVQAADLQVACRADSSPLARSITANGRSVPCA